MTPTRYFLSRVAHTLGIHRRNQRMSDAASETHLLRDAEAYLGAMIWKKVENIEALSSSYWNLRKLSQEQESISSGLAACQEKLNKAHEERAVLLNSVSEPEQKFLAEKAGIVAELGTLSARRDEIVSAAKEIRKSYEGLKVKSEVLANQSGGSQPTTAEIDKINASLGQLKERFTSLKAERTRISEEIIKGDQKINEISEQIQTFRKSQQENASKAIQSIGDANKDISTLRAEYGILDTRMSQLHAEIGKHVSRNLSVDPACAEAVRDHRGLVEVMQALRKSITLNYRLADM
jgi:chromosome segregation ATPase